MTIQEQITILNRLHSFIQRKATGSPRILANKLGISEATLYRYLKRLKSHGADIKYNKYRKTYYYINNYVLKF